MLLLLACMTGALLAKRGERDICHLRELCGLYMACANHSLQSCFLQNEFFGELIVFRHLSLEFAIIFNVILSDLSKLSLSF